MAMNSFDRSATYYKIIGANCCGNYPYKLGLNTLADNGEIFNKEPICGPGGLYFCSIKYIFIYLNHGDKLCTLTIPYDAQVVKVYNKYKADQIYIEKMMEINDDTIKYLIEHGADVTADNNRAMYLAIDIDDLEMIKLFVKYGVDITVDDNFPIQFASAKGHLEIVKYLVECGADITADSSYVIGWAAYCGHLEVIKYLIEHGADATAHNNYAIRSAAKNGHSEVVECLAEHGAVL